MKKNTPNLDGQLVCGDCLKELRLIESNSIDLIYLDPPFFTQKEQALKTRDNKTEYSFNDEWLDIHEYITYMKDRLLECKRVLKETGNLFLHCDRSASHYLRVILDEIFGFNNFQSEIVWAYKRWSNTKKGLLNCHQIIYFYSKSSKFKFNKIFEEYSPTTNIDQIFQKRIRDINGKTKYKKNGDERVELMEEKNGVPLSDVWQIPYLNPKANERVGYPTQKPILLLERIINIATDIEDIVLDPFYGSGTTLVAAKLLNRKYFGIDISKQAIRLCRKRLSNPIRSESNLLKLGTDAYLNQIPERLEILKSIDAVPVQRHKGIDGFLKIDGTVRPIPVKIQSNSESLEEALSSLIKASEKNGFSIKILIALQSNIKSVRTKSKDVVIINDLAQFSKLKETLRINKRSALLLA